MAKEKKSISKNSSNDNVTKNQGNVLITIGIALLFVGVIFLISGIILIDLTASNLGSVKPSIVVSTNIFFLIAKITLSGGLLSTLAGFIFKFLI